MIRPVIRSVIRPTVKAAGEVFGPDIVINGGFDTDTDWTKEAGWVISGGKATYSGVDFNFVGQNIAFEIGKKYKIVFEVTGSVAGADKLSIRSDNTTTLGTTIGNGTHEIITTISAGDSVRFYASFNTSRFAGSIDNVAVREVSTGGGVIST